MKRTIKPFWSIEYQPMTFTDVKKVSEYCEHGVLADLSPRGVFAFNCTVNYFKRDNTFEVKYPPGSVQEVCLFEILRRL